MKFFESFTSAKTILWASFILSAIIIYPNIGDMVWRLCSPPESNHYRSITLPVVLYFIYRYLFFVLLTWILLRLNIRNTSMKLKERFTKSFFLTFAGYIIYVCIGLSITHIIRLDCFTQMPILQFLIAWLLPVLMGHIYYLTVVQRETQQEMEKLRSETLQSRVDALSNQINPHFFFNSLNGLKALVAAGRGEETLEYVDKLSGIFRYILQSEKRGLVSLREELDFLNAYRYLIEVCYRGKISFAIQVEESDQRLQLPVLSLLPLIENVVKHNIIDSEHKMSVRIYMASDQELTVTNPVYRRYDVEGSNGIGLSNLSARYRLLMERDIEVVEEEYCFTVVLPLKKVEDEGVDR
ncbi:MAG: histidine kinase [Bacteroides sp.]|nr:histidine kinase [Bacteroides sp.]